MKTFIALLRGINVSGQKKIKMAELRAHLESRGYQEVRTYVQSGNIVFGYDETSFEKVSSLLEEFFHQEYGFEVKNIIVDHDTISRAYRENPFISDETKDPKRQFISFLDKVPEPERFNSFDADSYKPEEFVTKGRIIYGHSPEGLGKAKMNNNFFESKLKVTATTRNLNTVKALIEMTRGT